MKKKPTPRELEVARLIAREYTDKAIARELHISASTIYNHMQSVRTKLGVCSRIGVAIWIVRNDTEEGQP